MILRALSMMAVAVCAAAPAFAETRFFSAIDDLPLAPGLSEIAGGWSVDMDEGLLTEVHAAGQGRIEDMRAFYLASLPALGWSLSPQRDQTLIFLRGREKLMFAFGAPGGRVTLRVRLLVQRASMRPD